jgi:hypothetical protein
MRRIVRYLIPGRLMKVFEVTERDFSSHVEAYHLLSDMAKCDTANAETLPAHGGAVNVPDGSYTVRRGLTVSDG